MSRPHWLILGSGGMLGRGVVRHAQSAGMPHTCWTRRELDLASEPGLHHAWPAPPPGATHLINCTAYTAVDDAEMHKALAHRVNGEAVGGLAHYAERYGLMLVHFSTDYVFNGRAKTPYPVDHPRDPINAYGSSKAAGEAAIEAVDPGDGRWLVLRTSWLHADWGTNFRLTMQRLMAERGSLQVVDDQVGRPTTVPRLVATLQAMLEADARGVHHATGGGAPTTWFGFAREIARRIGYTGTLKPCSTDAFPRPAARPAYAVLDLQATEAHLGPLPDWRADL